MNGGRPDWVTSELETSLRPRLRGRPKSADPKASRITLRLRQAELANFLETARQLGLQPARAGRQALTEFVERHRT